MFDQIREKAVATASMIMETMFFMTPELQEEGTGEVPQFFSASQKILRSEMAFEGKCSGRLILYLPREFVETLVVNFTGTEEVSSDHQILDMVSEICNMICGNFTVLLDPKSAWRFTLPRTQSVPHPEGKEEGEETGVILDFLVDGHGFRLVLLISEGPG